MTTTEANDAKKRYLNGYRQSKRKAERLEEQIKELRGQQMFPSVQNDGMPKGNGRNDLSDYAAALDDLIEQLGQERENAIKAYREIHDRIQTVPDATEREVLERRYLMGEGWERIAVEMNYTYRHITRIHGEALRSFRLPERCPRMS